MPQAAPRRNRYLGAFTGKPEEPLESVKIVEVK